MSANVAGMMNKLGWGLLLGGCLAATGAWGQGTQSPAGDWQGTLGGQLPLVLHLRVADGGLTATLDSPAQGAMGLQGANAKVSGSTLSFDIPVIQGSYSGTLSANGKTLTGEWKQVGKTFPLVFQMTATEAQLAAVKPTLVDGDWGGELHPGSVTLRLVFHFHAEPGGGIAGSLDSIDQGAMGIACSDVKLDGQKLTLSVPAVHGTYEGTLNADGKSIAGTWTQGKPMELNLTRTEPVGPPKMLPARPPVAVKDLPGVLRQEFAPLMKAWPQGGVVVGVLDHGQREVMAFGSAKANSIFEIGSVTKTFTALTLAQMVMQKKVTLDEPVRELLPAGWVAKPAGEEISLLDLATHHSGLPRLPDNLKPANPADPYADYGPEQLEAFLKEHGVGRPAKTEFLYSNLGMGLLGFALAQKAGMPYAEMIQQEVTGPMGLKDTVITLSPEQQKRFIQGYDGAHDAAGPWHLDALEGAGALRSTAADLLTYCDSMMHPERLKGKHGDGATLAEAIPMALAPRADVGGGAKIALAWVTRPETEVYSHDGGTGGYSSLVIFDLKKDRAIVVLYNCEDITPGQLQLTERVAANVTGLLEGKPAMGLE
jgi:D-alanyl-D-alanine-carboxypeptidase/D-alanyl-D-alanine-endopeptidase